MCRNAVSSVQYARPRAQRAFLYVGARCIYLFTIVAIFLRLPADADRNHFNWYSAAIKMFGINMVGYGLPIVGNVRSDSIAYTQSRTARAVVWPADKSVRHFPSASTCARHYHCPIGVFGVCLA